MDHATAARLKQKRTVSNALANIFLAVLGLQGGIAIGAGVIAQPMSDWSHPNLAITAVSRIAAMVGTFLALMCLVLIARVPWLEQEIGQDRLVKWHRLIAPYSLYLIVIHVVLVSVGYGMLDGINLWSEFWRLTLGSSWMLPALAGFVFMMMVGITSYKRARSRMQYETWWLLHLYSYLASRSHSCTRLFSEPCFSTARISRSGGLPSTFLCTDSSCSSAFSSRCRAHFVTISVSKR